MKKRLLVAAIAAVFVITLGGSAMAMEPKGKLGLGLEVGTYNLMDADVPNWPAGELQFDNVVFFGGNVTYFPADFFSVELGSDWIVTDIASNPTPSGNDWGELTQVPILLTGRFHIPNKTIMSPYLGFGFGYYFNNFDVNARVKERMLPLYYAVEVEDSFGFHINGGMEIFATDFLAFDIDLKYVWNNVEYQETMNSIVTADDEFETNAFSAGLGIKYYFF